MTEDNRSAKRMVLNSCIRRVNRLITSRDKENARSLCEDLTSKYDDFESAHEEHAATLTKSKSIESAVEYFNLVYAEFDDAYSKLMTLLHGNSDTTDDKESINISNLSSSLVEAVTLPKLEIRSFYFCF